MSLGSKASYRCEHMTKRRMAIEDEKTNRLVITEMMFCELTNKECIGVRKCKIFKARGCKTLDEFFKVKTVEKEDQNTGSSSN